MLEKIIEASVRNQLLVLLFTATAIATGLYAFWNIPIDALPDVSDVQVIVFTEWQGQPPQIVEDQVTYPITTTMLSVANARVVRGYSFFGLSFVYVIFNDGTDVYWARSRVLEYLSFVQNQLPPGVTPVLGPDATPVGWIFEYALIAPERTTCRSCGAFRTGTCVTNSWRFRALPTWQPPAAS